MSTITETIKNINKQLINLEDKNFTKDQYITSALYEAVCTISDNLFTTWRNVNIAKDLAKALYNGEEQDEVLGLLEEIEKATAKPAELEDLQDLVTATYKAANGINK